jgi:hypothetical protein
MDSSQEVHLLFGSDVRRHKNNAPRCGGVSAFDVSVEGHAIHSGHPQIAHDDIVGLLLEAVEPRLSVGRRLHSIAGMLDDPDDQCAQVFIIIDYEYPSVRGLGPEQLCHRLVTLRVYDSQLTCPPNSSRRMFDNASRAGCEKAYCLRRPPPFRRAGNPMVQTRASFVGL